MRCRDFVRISMSCVLVVVCATFATAAVKLPAVIGDNMVLQREQPVPIWGWADAGEKVTVSILGQSKSAEPDASGKWMLRLDPVAVGGPYTMTVAGKNTITLKNILVGEVWLCSGQSNMQMGVGGSNDAQQEIAAANYPQIRLISVPTKGAQEPQQDFKGQWAECSPQTAGGFSAAAYFFGRKLQQDLKVPVGLIHCSWGGSSCEAWVKRSLLEADPRYESLLKTWDQTARTYDPAKAKQAWQKQHDAWKKLAAEAKAAGKKAPNAPHPLQDPLVGQHRPANLYNGMLLSVMPYGIRGAIWYQGESNIGRAYQYRHLFPLMIRQWREEWGQGDFPFGFVQIAPYRYNGQNPANCPELWEAQAMTLKSSPNTGMAVTMDIGDVKNIHPTNKQEVGRRLALWALAKVYGQNLVYSGPIYKSMTVGDGKIRLQFDHVGGLASSDGKPLRDFTIAGADQKFVPAVAEIDGDAIVVRNDQVSAPVAVRYAWRDDATPNLANKEGLPASPFRTDTWKGVTEGK